MVLYRGVVKSSLFFYIFKDFIVSIDDLCGDYYQMIYDDNLNIIDTIEISDFNENGSLEIYGETDDFYYIGYNFFDKKTKQRIDEMEMVESHPNYEEIDRICREGQYFDECVDGALEVYGDIFSGTILPVIFNLEAGRIDLYDKDLANIFVNGNNGYALSFYYYYEDKYSVEFYDSDMNLTQSIILDSYIEPYVLFKDNYFYIFEVKGKPPLPKGRVDEDYYFSVAEYDYNFTKRNQFDLSLLSKEDEINLEPRFGRNFWKILATDDGFVMMTKVNARDESISEEDMQESYDSIQKYSFTYSVDVKDNKNGSILLDKENFKNGETIKYTVQPKKGYKLDKVIVTDANGNKVEIKDYTFVMPSSNITVEAIFVVDNPNTSVFLGRGALLVFLVTWLSFILLKNIKVKRYE